MEKNKWNNIKPISGKVNESHEIKNTFWPIFQKVNGSDEENKKNPQLDNVFISWNEMFFL